MVSTPLGTILQAAVKKVTFETLNGYHTLLPRHVDFVSAMGANIVSYVTVPEEKEKYMACYQGIVVKKADVVTITVQSAVLSDDLTEMEKVIQEYFKQNNEQRKELNTAMARLELGLIRGFGRLSGGDANG